MKIYKATSKDIGDLIQLRIDFLKMDHGSLSDEKESMIRNQSKEYFEKHIPAGDFIGAIARNEKEEIVSAAFLIIQERPANPSFITGLTATLLNVITYSEYRRKGIASQVIKFLIEEAELRNVSSIDLFATKQGKELYEKLGFSLPNYTAMRLKV